MSRMRGLARVRNGLATLVVVVGGLVFVTAAPASAAVIDVTTTADGGAGSLRAAFDTANGNGADTQIVLHAGQVYQLTVCPPGANDEDGNADGDLDYTGQHALIIRGNGATIEQTCDGERVIDIVDATAFTLDSTTVTGGATDGDGGGIEAPVPTTISASVITGNAANGDGGGLDSSVGGAQTTITASTISGNFAAGEGGGVSAGGGGAQTSVTSSTISGNEAGEAGGGLSSGGGSASTAVVGSTIAGNTAGAEGGGVDAGGGESTHTYVNSTITGNRAETGGGISSSRDAAVELTYVTLADNTASVGANLAIYTFGEAIDFGQLVSFGSVIADGHVGVNCSLPGPATQSDGYNYDTGSSCGFGGAPGDVVGGGNPHLGALADNGGPTATRLPLSGSPLIDAIPVAACAPGITVDQRGVTRPQDGDGNGSSGCDIGAVEVVFTPDTPLPATPLPLAPRFTG
jgi:hypothetical protein